MAMLPCFYSAADSKFSPSLQLSRAEFVTSLLEAFSAYPCSWSLKSRNYANFKSASHCFFFFQETSSKYLILQKNILAATHRVELSPSRDLTTLILYGMGQIVWTVWTEPLWLYSSFSRTLSLSQDATDYSTGFLRLYYFLEFHSLLSCLQVCFICAYYTADKLPWRLFPYYTWGVLCCSPVEMAGWSKLQDLLLQQSFLAAHSKTGQKICLCICWVGCSHALNPDKMRKECVQFFWFRI